MKRAILILLVLGAAAFAYFVYPTRYEKAVVGTGEFARPARVDRFTGSVEIQDRGGRWRTIGGREMLAGQPETPQPASQDSTGSPGLIPPAASPDLMGVQQANEQARRHAQSGNAQRHVQDARKTQQAMDKAVSDAIEGQ